MVNNDELPYVEFYPEILSPKDKSTTEILAKVNGKEEEVRVIFNGNTMYLFPNLKGNTDHKMTFNFASQDIELDFKTAFADFDLNNADFNTKNNQSFFSADISLKPFL